MKAKKIIALLASVSLLLVAVLVPMMSASADDVEFPAIYGTDKVVLESFNEVESGSAIWNDRPVCTEDDIEGVDGGAIYLNYNDQTATLDKAWDTTDYMDGKHAFKLRIYSEDDYAWRIGNDDNNNANTTADWNILFFDDDNDNVFLDYGKRFYLTAGWNDIYLPIVDSCVNTSKLSDIDKIGKVRMYDNGASGDRVWLDEIAIVSYTPAKPVYDAVNRVLYLDRAEDMSVYEGNHGMYYDGNGIKADSITVPEGNAAIFSRNKYLKRSYPATDSHVTRENGALVFWLYVADVDALDMEQGWLNIFSNGSTTTDLLSYNQVMKYFDLHDGWNEVTLKFSENVVQGDFNPNAITYVHLEWGYKDGLETLVGIDNMRIVNLDGGCPHDNKTETAAKVEADCGRAGKEAVYTCIDCEKTGIGGETIDATGNHDSAYFESGTCGVCNMPNPDYREPGVYYVDVDGPTAGVVDQNVSVTVDVTCEGETVFAAGEMTVTYDSAKFEYVDITGLGTQGDVDSTTAGTLKISDSGADKALGDAVYTITFKAIADGEATITLDAAAFSNKENAETLNLSDATVADGDNDSVTVAIRKANHAVALPSEGFTGNSEVKDGADYTFSWTTDGAHYDYSEVTATMGGVDVHVIDDGNGNYTIEKVTGALVITATRTPKQFTVTITGDTDSNDGETATYNTSYSFTLPADKAAGQEAGYSYAMTGITIAGTNYTGYETSADGRTFTIPGTAVTGDIAITITKTDLAANQFTVTVTGSGAGQITVSKGENTLASGDVVNKDDVITVTLAKAEGYVYTVTVDGTAVTVFPHEITVAANVNIVAERAIDTSTVDVDTYLDLDEATMWLITIGNKQIEGKTYTYTYNDETVNMFWSEEYGAYCTLVVGTETKPTPTAAEFTIADDVAAETVNYGMDVNKSSEVDTNDAQLVYNMYNAEYSGFTTNVTMEKFLRADVNGDKTVNVEDAAAIVAHVLSLNANA